jgi:hypothetical protein
MYAVRYTIQPSIKMNIYNQCSNVDLISPVYITGYGLKYCNSPGYRVCAGSTMKSSLIIYDPESEPDGALIYRLQKRNPYKSIRFGRNTSGASHLLIMWRSKFKELCADVLLIEHDKGLDKNDLNDLYRKNNDRLSPYSDPVLETWLLDGNTALMATFEIMNEDCILNITISEIRKDNSTRAPVHIDPER